MNLTVTIESAELQFKQILEEFFISVYDENSLYSHGIDHHRRVWNYSKQLLTIHTGKNHPGISQLPAKLIIASYLHDIGMSVETGSGMENTAGTYVFNFFTRTIFLRMNIKMFWMQ